ncbi:MAG: GDP-mannose 4,6-dehydratase [Candidatus Omnitrophica bacterium]|nr:GDP-mannose 4,6-dehydratase [Candidatus Omnitrophota bacterium]MDD5237069.1 GDP-mannose 4,6-dehydratase [Candidatus Omnitrophota bacterium]MDD5610191.1 GDP-mannose 4,6-dehydratase [Candidatus Omnitrophota bacterium]
MRILITGGAGMVGSHCAEHFAQKKDDVVVLDNLMRSQLFGYDKDSVEFNWNYLTKYKNITRVKGDVRNIEDVEKAIKDGVDAVIHTAGQPGVPSSVRMPREDFSINAYGTLNVLECVRQKNKNAVIVYCSTNKVYGENVDKIPLKEKEKRYVFDGVKGVSESMLTDLTGHTPYGVSKLTGDLYTQEYGHIYGMRTGIFRMSCIYGTRQFGFEDQGWVAWFIIATLHNKPITIYGNGKQVRDLLYVEDLAKAFDKFIQSDLRGEVMNIGGGGENTISLLEFVDELEKLTKKRPKITFSDWRPSDQKVYVSDITKVKNKLNWSPTVSPQEGIEKLWKWVKDNESCFSR